MRILVDTHTHTNASDHAFSTIKENIEEAAAKGLELLVTTNHSPSMSDGAHDWHFYSIPGLPRIINGVKLMFGIEADILDTDGKLGAPDSILKGMDVVIASFHDPIFIPSSKEDHTKAWLNALNNPYVDICGHSGNPKYDFEFEPVIRAAKDKNVCIEINNSSFEGRKGSEERCREIAKLCKKIGTKVVVGSDAHCCWKIGEFGYAINLLHNIDFPEELVMNLTADKFTDFMEIKKEKKFYK